MATARNNWKKQLAYLQLNNSVPKLIYILYIFGGLGNIGKQFETLLKGNRELLRAPPCHLIQCHSLESTTYTKKAMCIKSVKKDRLKTVTFVVMADLSPKQHPCIFMHGHK